jgi:hypothetical protein
LRAEIDEHVALLTDENIRAALSPIEARREALRKFGAIEAMKENYRDRLTFTSVETLVQDIRHALRRLRMAPTFTAATVLTLALGIGATTSIFSLVNAVMLKSLPVASPGELYRLGRESRCCYLSGYSQDREFSLVSYELYEYLRDHSQGFAELAPFPSGQLLFGVRRAGEAHAARSHPGEFVSGNYFSMLGIRVFAGRLLTPEDDKDGAPPAAVITYRTWQQRYGADPSLGANRGQVVMLVLRGAFGLVVIGLCVGLPLTFVVGRLLTSQLYGTGPSRPVVILGAALALGWSACVAALAPAIRASMMPPSVALRAD